MVLYYMIRNKDTIRAFRPAYWVLHRSIATIYCYYGQKWEPIWGQAQIRVCLISNIRLTGLKLKQILIYETQFHFNNFKAFDITVLIILVALEMPFS